MGSEDEFYSANIVGSLEGNTVATDPFNEISKQLQSQRQFRSGLEELTPSISIGISSFEDVVMRERHRRQVFAATLSRPR
jgi:hypothetical protein